MKLNKSSPPELKDDQVLVRNVDKFLYTKVDEEAVLMNIDNGRYLGLNEVSTDIWTQINPSATLSQIVRKLLTLYDVDEVQCYNETKELLTAMLSIALIKTKE